MKKLIAMMTVLIAMTTISAESVTISKQEMEMLREFTHALAEATDATYLEETELLTTALMYYKQPYAPDWFTLSVHMFEAGYKRGQQSMKEVTNE